MNAQDSDFGKFPPAVYCERASFVGPLKMIKSIVIF